MYRIDNIDPELAADAWVAYGFLHDAFEQHPFTLEQALAGTTVTQAELFLLDKADLLDFDGTYYRLRYGRELSELEDELESGDLG